MVPLAFLPARSRSKDAAVGGRIREALELVESFRRRGVEVSIDAYPYERATTNLGESL